MNAKAPMMFGRNFDPGFRIELHLKDVNNAMQTAKELQVPLQVTANLQQVLTALVADGKGTLDHSGILHFVEMFAHHLDLGAALRDAALIVLPAAVAGWWAVREVQRASRQTEEEA